LASLEKPDCSVCYSGISGFGSFRLKLRNELKDLKIQSVLRHEKRLRSIKEPIWKKSKPKAEAAKIRWFGFGFWRVPFSQNRYSSIRV
jgi:hypothetical protein